MLLKTGACFTTELAANCPTIVGCVAALPLGPAAVAGTTQVLGKDGQYHTLPAVAAQVPQALTLAGQTLSLSNGGGSVTLPDSDAQALSITGNVISLTNGGSVTLPTTAAPVPQTLSIAGSNLTISGGNTVALPAVSVPFATPTQTVAGTSTTLAVNPADLYARENIPAQTGVSNDVMAIPAPTASQSNWATNLLGETLHYAPGVGWKIVADLSSGTVGLGAAFTPSAQGSIEPLPGLSFTMARTGKVNFALGIVCSAPAVAFGRAAVYLMKNGVLFSRLGGSADSLSYTAKDISGAATDVLVSSGDVFSISGQYIGDSSFSFSPSLNRFSYQYNA